ncbi:MAG TPA: DNA adenine methylase, partial [Flavobacteriaceae bacterium]|nr:DNA adenine methylase [Flavobacteriaceae bacterium]
KAIPQTNKLLAKLRHRLNDLPRKGRIPESMRQTLLEVVKSHENEYGYVDYITLSGSILFSAKYVTHFEDLSKETFSNRIKLADYDSKGYLEGVDRVQMDYKLLFEASKKHSNVVYLVDPPYLSTDVSTYGSKEYWKLRDYLDVLSVLDGTQYFYFTSNKSQIVELCDWIESRTSTGNPFAGATMTTTSSRLNYAASYTDIMIYK